MDNTVRVQFNKVGNFEVSTRVSSYNFETRVFNDDEDVEFPEPLKRMLKARLNSIAEGTMCPVGMVDDTAYESFAFGDAYFVHNSLREVVEEFLAAYTRTVTYVAN